MGNLLLLCDPETQTAEQHLQRLRGRRPPLKLRSGTLPVDLPPLLPDLSWEHPLGGQAEGRWAPTAPSPSESLRSAAGRWGSEFPGM